MIVSVILPDTTPILYHATPMRSRYSDTDQMGYVYHANFLAYFEVARTEMIRSFGFTYAQLEAQGYLLPIANVAVDYKEPLLYDEPFVIHTYIFRQPSVRLETWYKVTDESSDRLKAQGQVTLVFMDAVTRRPTKAPAFFLDHLTDAGAR